jgi:DNA-binding transcriptional ArsR family regulator
VSEGPHELTDPRALRALAHPLRVQLLALLRREGPMTATQLSEHVGESPASCSFHLRQLARYGLIAEAGVGPGRQRPWKATSQLTTWTTVDPTLVEIGQELAGLTLYLTDEELAGVRSQLAAIAEQYAARTANPAQRPPGARPVRFVQLAPGSDG